MHAILDLVLLLIDHLILIALRQRRKYEISKNTPRDLDLTINTRIFSGVFSSAFRNQDYNFLMTPKFIQPAVSGGGPASPSARRRRIKVLPNSESDELKPEKVFEVSAGEDPNKKKDFASGKI